MRKFYDNETREILTLDDLQSEWLEKEEWERYEYAGFWEWLACCMWWNNGTLEEI